MAENRPHGRERNVTGTGNAHRRGSGLGTGPVGNASRPGGGSRGGGSSRGPGRSPLTIIILIIALLLGGGTGVNFLGGSDPSSGGAAQTETEEETYSSTMPAGWLFGQNMTSGTGTYASTSVSDKEPDYTVAKEAREKYVDTARAKTATVFVYMCGADLESRSGMATSDLKEMIAAIHSDQVKIIVETGGAKSWRNNQVSSACLQRWQVVDGGLVPLESNAGNASMTDPSTLKAFVDWGMQNYRSDRSILILWDHGGGSVSGYGYDEKFNNGSMRIDQVASALSSAKGSFDFVGFDACLMATLETATALAPYSDYLLASEETEPGTGWYYTDWLTSLGEDPSISTVDLGKTIIDTYTSHSQGQTTLSLTDLAELSGTVGTPLKDFSTKLAADIKSDEAKTVADARANTKEFARSSAIDQVDLVDFTDKLGTEEGRALADVIKSAVKYSRTQGISNSYGLSVYFPYRNNRLVSKMSDINDAIAMDSDYTGAIKSFATLNASAQSVTSQTSSTIFDLLGGAMPSNGTELDTSSIFSALSGGGFDLGSLLGGSSGIASDDFTSISQILGRSHLASSDLAFTENDDGQTVLALSEDEWSDIHEINLNVWVDDGSGYIDLGFDNIYDFDANGNLLVDYDGAWIALDGQPAAVYATDAEYGENGSYTLHSYIPAMLNGEQVRILLEYSDENPKGQILGAEKVYDSGTSGKGLIDIVSGDKVELLCDYYDKGGSYEDTYYLGDPITVGDSLVLSDVELTNDSYLYGYALKDTWNSTRYTPYISS